MKKKSFKNLSLDKSVVSDFKMLSTKGGMVSRACSERTYEDDDGNIICCTFVGPGC